MTKKNIFNLTLTLKINMLSGAIGEKPTQLTASKGKRLYIGALDLYQWGRVFVKGTYCKNFRTVVLQNV